MILFLTNMGGRIWTSVSGMRGEQVEAGDAAQHLQCLE